MAIRGALSAAIGIAGVWAAHLMFDQPLWQVSATIRSGPGQWLAEWVATFGLLVAILGYLVMTNDYLTHIVFLFPEVLLCLLAVFILMGRYTGYRVTEIMRFKDIVEPPSDARPHS